MMRTLILGIGFAIGSYSCVQNQATSNESRERDFKQQSDTVLSWLNSNIPPMSGNSWHLIKEGLPSIDGNDSLILGYTDLASLKSVYDNVESYALYICDSSNNENDICNTIFLEIYNFSPTISCDAFDKAHSELREQYDMYYSISRCSYCDGNKLLEVTAQCSGVLPRFIESSPFILSFECSN